MCTFLRRLARAAAVATVGLGMAFGDVNGVAALEKPIDVPATDADMTAAIAKARQTIDTFWAAHAKPATGESGFSLKVAITAGGVTEHIWLRDVTRSGTLMSGRIANDPARLKSFRRGQRHQFGIDQLSDWMFLRDGRIVGNYTLRAMLKLMPQGRAEALRAKLTDP